MCVCHFGVHAHLQEEPRRSEVFFDASEKQLTQNYFVRQWHSAHSARSLFGPCFGQSTGDLLANRPQQNTSASSPMGCVRNGPAPCRTGLIRVHGERKCHCGGRRVWKSTIEIWHRSCSFFPRTPELPLHSVAIRKNAPAQRLGQGSN